MNKNSLFGAFNYTWSTADQFTPFGSESIRFIEERPEFTTISVIKEIPLLDLL